MKNLANYAIMSAIILFCSSAQSKAEVGYRNIFIGGTCNFLYLRKNVSKLIKTNRVGLYEHGSIMSYISDDNKKELQSTWYDTGARPYEGGGFALAEAASGYWNINKKKNVFGRVGPPVEAIINLPSCGEDYHKNNKLYHCYISSKYSNTIISYIKYDISHTNSKNIIPFIDVRDNLDEKFSTGAYYKYARKLAMYSGGMSIDIPPTYIMSHDKKIIDNIMDSITWCLKNKLRITYVISPWGNCENNNNTNSCQFDKNLLKNTKYLLEKFSEKGSYPTEYVVENYCEKFNDDCEVNSPVGDNIPGSLNEVALWLTTQHISPPATSIPKSYGGLSQKEIYEKFSYRKSH